jgi:hypothetical protein
MGPDVCYSPEIPQRIADGLTLLKRIQWDLDKLYGVQDNVRKRHEQELKDLDTAAVAIQSLCPHPVTRRSADPAGDSGSIECIICGKDLTPREARLP